MVQKMFLEGSVSALAEYVKKVDIENRGMINRALATLARELTGNQHLIHQALQNYRDGLNEDLSDDEFYDLVAFLGAFTSGFNENRIDVSIIAEGCLSDWQNRTSAPLQSVRRNMVLLLIDTAMEQGLLSGVGYLNEWVGLASDDCVAGNWLLVGQDKK
jgi:hypothetical protein